MNDQLNKIVAKQIERSRYETFKKPPIQQFRKRNPSTNHPMTVPTETLEMEMKTAKKQLKRVNKEYEKAKYEETKMDQAQRDQL